MCSQASASGGETGTIGKARVLVCDGDCAQKQRRKTAEPGRRCGDAQSRTTQEASARASETKCGGIAPAATALARKTRWDAGTRSVPASTAKCDAGADKGARKAGAAVSVLPVLSKGKAGECARDAVGRDAGASSFCAEEVSCVRKCLRDDDACATTRQR
ncbi:hypothetical protein ERJ75_000684700 [Trypanosoma vivax]|nr:hypothetical protein ERJ75_000684700 [Trypanosoma vivax]